jgi:hypothetical protein
MRFVALEEAREWMGWHNVPVLLVPDEPIRTHWTEILETAEGSAPRGAARLSFRRTKTTVCGSSGSRRSSSVRTASPDLSNTIPTILVTHRDRIYAKYLELPLRL